MLDFFTNDKDDERAQPVLNVLTDQEYEFIASKDPAGTYDRDMRESIYWILGKLEEADRKCSRYEKKIYRRFIAAHTATTVFYLLHKVSHRVVDWEEIPW